MKKIVSTFFILGLAVNAELKLSISNKNIKGNPNTHELSCEGAQGTVQYSALGLPSGVQFNGSAFIITNQASAGNYPIRVKATDASGNSIENVVILTINASLKQIGNFKEQIKDTGSVQGASINNQLSKQAILVENNWQKPVLSKVNREQNGRLINGAKFNTAVTQQINNKQNQPSTSTQTNNLERLTNILSTYSTSPSDYVRPNKNQNSDRYPQINFPTLTIPTGPNPTTMNIENSQAIRSSSNRNQITADDVTLRAASERHQNSIKGITNLLKLIDQAKANKDKAQADIQTYTQAFNDAVMAQKNVQNQIYTNQNKVSQIISSINAVSSLVQDLKKRVNEIVTQSEVLKKQRASVVETFANREAQKNSLAQKLKVLDVQASNKIQELSEKSEQCQKIYKYINQKQVEIDNAEKELSRTQEDHFILVEDIKKKTILIDDIKKQLDQAENELANARKRLQDIDQRRLALPVEIYKLKQQLKNLEQKSKGCAQQILKITQRINLLKNQNIQKLTKQINDISVKMNSNTMRISQIDAQLQKINSQSADFQPKINQSISDLAFLRAQQIQNENALRIAYQKGNDINNKVALARQNLQAAVKRFQNEYKIVTGATLNLQKARAEEALARLSLEELIAYYSDALPYAIVPNANLGTNPGNPYGNNPSGSPLGQIKINGNGSPGGFKINSWVNYLSSAYGSGVNPSFIGSVTELFPFNFLSSVNGNSIANGNMRGIFLDNGNKYSENLNCSGKDSTSQQVATGSIASITDGGFVLQTEDGRSLKIRVSPCTRLNSNKAGYKMRYGDQAIVRGYVHEGDRKAIESVQITCLN